jgi:hypothetical protein
MRKPRALIVTALHEALGLLSTAPPRVCRKRRFPHGAAICWISPSPRAFGLSDGAKAAAPIATPSLLLTEMKATAQ